MSIEKLPSARTPQRVRIKVREAGDLHPGDDISVLARLSPPAAPDMPGAFDFQRYAWFKGIGGFGFSYAAPVVTAAARAGAFGQAVQGLRQNIAARIDRAVPYPQAAVVKTLASGHGVDRCGG